ncbi:MAG: cyanophycinase [Mycobacterium leprae]
MKLDRLGDITSELSANLVKSILLPGGLMEWLSKPLAERLREKAKATAKPGEGAEARSTVALGPTVLFGGAPIPDEAIVALLHLAGGRSAKVAVIPVAATDQARAVEDGVRLFTRFGMRCVEVLELTTKERAESPEWAAQLADHDCVLLCGDSPELGLQALSGTACAATLREMQAAGKPVAGLNAGAMLLGDRIMLQRDGGQVLEKGLGLAAGLLIESSFTQTTGFGQMVKALGTETASGLLGIGLEDGTALVIRDGEAKILGETSVTVMDMRESLPGSAPAPVGAVCGLKVHVLTDGYGLNLRTRKPITPPKEPAHAVGER